jgi:2'-5' RNA ligase
MKATTYHLWLKPSGPAYEVLAGLIRDLGKELRAPVFEPHVTLLGHLEGSEQDHVQRTTRLGERLKPFWIDLGAASYRNEYFKCLFLRVNESAAVMNAHAAACEVFQRIREEYMPHLSLVYGAYTEERKKGIIRGLPALAQTSFPVRSVDLLRADSDDPKDWREILSIPMTERLAGGGR